MMSPRVLIALFFGAHILLVNVNCVPLPVPEDVNTSEKSDKVSEYEQLNEIFDSKRNSTTKDFAGENVSDMQDSSSASVPKIFMRVKSEDEDNKDSLVSSSIQNERRENMEQNAEDISKIDVYQPEETSEDTPKRPLNSAVNNLFNTFRKSFRRVLQNSQHGLLRAIGTVDKTVKTVGEGIQNSSFAVVLEGQKAAAKLYDLAPPQVNKWIQRIGTTRNNRAIQQIGSVVNQYRDNNRNFYDAFEEHEHHFHDTFNGMSGVWSNVNKYLGVPELPKMKLAWY